ncbi:MAG TPA: hypothetical protein VIV11_20705 [Kofleriaceae bacterium]
MKTLVLLALVQAACSCWEAEIRNGTIALRLEGGDATDGTASYSALIGHSSGCDSGDNHDGDNNSTFEPARNATVELGPSDGALVRLAADAAEPGRYTADAPTAFARTYRFHIDDEHYTLDAPRYFTATATGLPPVITLVEDKAPGDFGELWTGVVVTHVDSGLGYYATSFSGTTSPPIAANFSRPGRYSLALERDQLTLYDDPDGPHYTGTITLTRILYIDVP